MFKVVMRYPNGETEEFDEEFETEAEATAAGDEACGNYSEGGETLHMSNPGDYPLSDLDATFEVIEVRT